jgi:hypothetical protein
MHEILGVKIRRLESPFAADALHRQWDRRKIQNQTVGQTRGLQIAADDSKMDVFEVFDRLELDDDFVFDEKIEGDARQFGGPCKRAEWVFA